MPRMIPAAIATASVLTAALAFGVEPIPDAAAPRTQVYYYQQPVPVQQAAPVPQQPQQYYYAQPQPAQRPTVFGRMMDLERRKNQAILRFFGLR